MTERIIRQGGEPLSPAAEALRRFALDLGRDHLPEPSPAASMGEVKETLAIEPYVEEIYAHNNQNKENNNGNTSER